MQSNCFKIERHPLVGTQICRGGWVAKCRHTCWACPATYPRKQGFQHTVECVWGLTAGRFIRGQNIHVPTFLPSTWNTPTVMSAYCANWWMLQPHQTDATQPRHWHKHAWTSNASCKIRYKLRQELFTLQCATIGQHPLFSVTRQHRQCNSGNSHKSYRSVPTFPNVIVFFPNVNDVPVQCLLAF